MRRPLESAIEAAPRPVLRVSELVALLRDTLEDAFGEVWVEGEIASLHHSRAGHVYFDLKDPIGQLRAVMFRSSVANALVGRGFELQEGLQVRVRAHLDVYVERGALQLVVVDLEPCGEGALRLAFERLKLRLSEEGLFDAAHKRPLPFFPRCIGLVTSRQGAAIHDVIQGLARRGASLELLVYDARVQGEDAWREVVRGLHVLDADPRVEVIVVARGGGSLEDLWTFNREEVVRAIFELDTPVVSAIGHEVDLVLCDLVADARAATPTAAAELVVPDVASLRRRLRELERRLALRQRGRLRELAHRLTALRRGLVHPAARLAELGRRLQQARDRLPGALRSSQSVRAAELASLGARLQALSPLAVLGRGYSIASRELDGGILRSSAQVSAGEGVHVRLAHGSLRATVTETAPETPATGADRR